MISLDPHRDALNERIDVAVALIDETHGPTPSAISREARGIVVLLLFAAYENLLKTVTRTLLERAIKLRVSNRRLVPGFRVFALASTVKSLRALSHKKVYSQGLPKLIEVAASSTRGVTIDPNTFPDDGSYMRASQVELWCELFGLTAPNRLLHRTWNSINAVVTQRNGIAHGQLTPGEVGRRYTEPEIRQLIDNWRRDWLELLGEVEKRGALRDFYRLPG